jgi:nucleoside-diphosphate-sugar epimerase
VDNGDVPTDLVTGAFGFTGSRIAERLLAMGREVRTLTRRAAGRHPLSGRLQAQAPQFDDVSALRRQLAGVDCLYVTYWMRFPRAGASWAQMIDNVGRLVDAARDAGVRRIVYISVSNAARDASTAYFRAKAAAEELIRAGAPSYAIVRPTLLYGEGDILINNMAWTLRRLPVFGIPGDGGYRVQPVHVDDVADLCLALGAERRIVEADAAGPETYTFNELVALVRAAVGSRARLVHLPATVVLATTSVLGLLVRDVVLTRDEIRELTESLLTSRDPATEPRPTRLSDWLARHGDALGRRYSSELARNFRFERA